MQSKISQIEKDKYHMISLIYGIWEQKLKLNQAHRYTEQIGGCQQLEVGGGQNGWRGSKSTNF